MGWFDTVLSIGTTIGKVAGALSGAPQASCVHFGPRGSQNPALGQVVFYNDSNGTTWALNQDTTGPWSINFPGDPVVGSEPQDLTLAAASRLPISPAFQTAATGDVNHFTITQGAPYAGLSDPPAVNTNIHASTSQNATNNIQINVGSYLTASLNVSERTVQIGVVGVLTLVGIALLNVRGAGNTVVRIINAIRKTGTGLQDDPQHITVDIPAGIDLSGGLTYIEINAAVGNMSASAQCVPLTDDDVVMLRSLVGLN